MTPIVFVLCNFYDYNRMQIVSVTSSRKKALAWEQASTENFYEEYDLV
jgi:hypothetical protein